MYLEAARHTYIVGTWLQENHHIRENPKWRNSRQRTNGSLSFRYLGKLYNTTTLGTRTIKQDLGQLNLARGLKELDKVLISSRPWQLNQCINQGFVDIKLKSTYVANHDLLARLRFCVSSIWISSHSAATAAAATSTAAATATAAIATTAAIAIHSQSRSSRCLLIGARIIGVKILVREIAACACTAMSESTPATTTTEATSESASQSTSPETTRTTTKSSTEAPWT
jgi:hypothetical protein